ncbi:hypothetical protein KJ766_01835 [Patescibacteria group bacterium]|nr:hypothetical protein [Patescibacteria group bacterium]
MLDNPTYSREEAERYTSRYNHWKEVMDGINDFYDTKQWALDRLGDSEGWTEFVSVWSEYIENLPIDFLKERVPDFDKKIKRLKYWLGILPGATSNIRVAKGVREMEDIYFEFVTFYDSEDAIAKSLYDERINSNDRDFGVKVPGFPISMRTRKFLEEMSHRFEQLTMYGDTLFPQLVAEKTRLEDLGVPMDEKVLLEYLGSLQRSWSKAHFFQQPRRAVALHGFFPHDFPEIDSQDRILALTSVWMHEGEHLSESQFRGDVEAALPFLKIGGKYIIGPINKAIYFGGTESYFDCEGLTRALQSLADEGKIEFEFRKGVSRNIQSDFNGTEDTLINELESNTQKLSHNESASCVIITRLT